MADNTEHGDPHETLVHILAAMTAGVTSNVVTNPLWVVKTRFMTQYIAGMRSHAELPYRSTFDALRRIYRTEGHRGLYRGLVPSLFGVVHVAIQFPLYEEVKDRLTEPNGSVTTRSILVASAVSKVMASCVTYPHEVVRTRLQINRDRFDPSARPPGVITIAGRIWRSEGLHGFYRGMAVNLIRTVPNSAMTILTYELLMRRLTQLSGAAKLSARNQ